MIFLTPHIVSGDSTTYYKSLTGDEDIIKKLGEAADFDKEQDISIAQIDYKNEYDEHVRVSLMGEATTLPEDPRVQTILRNDQEVRVFHG